MKWRSWIILCGQQYASWFKKRFYVLQTMVMFHINYQPYAKYHASICTQSFILLVKVTVSFELGYCGFFPKLLSHVVTITWMLLVKLGSGVLNDIRQHYYNLCLWCFVAIKYKATAMASVNACTCRLSHVFCSLLDVYFYSSRATSLT